jgi:PKD repeat protein
VNKHLFHSSFLIILLLFLLGLLLPRSSAASTDLAASYSGYVELEGELPLTVSLSTAVTAPGDTVMLEANLSNTIPSQQTPSIRLVLPPSLRVASSTVPLAVSLNLQNNELTWRPLLQPGGSTTISLPLRVETADISQPIKEIQITLAHDEQSRQKVLPVWIGIAPQIQSVLRQTQATVGQPIVLQPELSGSGSLRQTWYLGDGRRVDVNNPTVVFPATGIYEIRLDVANPLATASGSARITVVPHPVAQFDLSDDTLSVGQTVPLLNFSGGKPPLQYRWDFGDGTILQGPNPLHSYQIPGTYPIQLTVENQYGRSEAHGLVTVGERPTADMEIHGAAASNEPVLGQAYGDDTVIQYRWDMGDGRYYEGEQIVHHYRSSGNFYVIMTASNQFGSTQIGRWVHVDQGTSYLFLPFIMQDELDESETDPFALDLDPIPLDAPFELGAVTEAEMLPPAERLLFYINEARLHFDREPLTHNATLSTVAQHHAADMARFAYTGHTGWDGSLPAERFLRFDYRGGYAGEATAWGFEHAYEAVEFWVNSDPHRPIVLNQFASEVGVGYVGDFNSPNVWYWTAEFGDGFSQPPQPLLRLGQPVVGTEALISADLNYSWNWPLPLGPNEEFVLYLYTGREVLAVDRTSQPLLGTRYSLPLVAYDWVTEPDEYSWRVRLLRDSETVAESEWRALTLLFDPNLPTPTPVTPAPTPTLPPETAVPTSTPTPAQPAATPLPPPPTMPPLVTATPQP